MLLNEVQIKKYLTDLAFVVTILQLKQSLNPGSLERHYFC